MSTPLAYWYRAPSAPRDVLICPACAAAAHPSRVLMAPRPTVAAAAAVEPVDCLTCGLCEQPIDVDEDEDDHDAGGRCADCIRSDGPHGCPASCDCDCHPQRDQDDDDDAKVHD